jgi:hypothetical protein
MVVPYRDSIEVESDAPISIAGPPFRENGADGPLRSFPNRVEAGQEGCGIPSNGVGWKGS